MFPLRDENRSETTPIATMALIALNVASWVFLQGLGNDPALQRSVCELGLVPGELLGRVAAGTRVQLGPNASCVLGPSNWLTVLT